MQPVNLNSLGDFEAFIETKIKTWSPDHRTALAAGMAERWLPVYVAFTEAEDWGDADGMRKSLESVWQHLQGNRLSRAEIARQAALVEDSTPHMDFTDDIGALAAAVMVEMALRSCRNEDNQIPALQAVISGFEAVVPDWDMDPGDDLRLWGKIRVQREFKTQMKLIELVEGIAHFDEDAIRLLRNKLGSNSFAGKAGHTTEAVKGPKVFINQAIFDQYRGIMEYELKNPYRQWWDQEGAEPGSTMWAIMLWSEWSKRYGRRRQMLDMPLADETGRQAIFARNRFLDSADLSIPDWGAELNEIAARSLEHNPQSYDVTSFKQPHSYGPSMRTLWHQALRAGYPGMEAWRFIMDWARSRPAAWDADENRKQRGRAQLNPELAILLSAEMEWQQAENPEIPWQTEVHGQMWQVRLNDFPDDFMYSLLIDRRTLGNFHDWPGSWIR